MHYYDAHTHTLRVHPHITSVFVCPFLELPTKIPANQLFVLGLHPWDVPHCDFQNWKNNFETYFNLQNCIGIGEIGLDYSRLKPDVNDELLLSSFMDLSLKYHKPAIFHLVKSHHVFLELLKKFDIHFPSLIHAYAHFELPMIMELSRRGFYFSLGVRELKRLTMNKYVSNKELLNELYKNLLLETDDSVNTIEECYNLAGEIFKVDQRQLHLDIERNFHAVFQAKNT